MELYCNTENRDMLVSICPLHEALSEITSFARLVVVAMKLSKRFSHCMKIA